MRVPTLITACLTPTLDGFRATRAQKLAPSVSAEYVDVWAKVRGYGRRVPVCQRRPREAQRFLSSLVALVFSAPETLVARGRGGCVHTKRDENSHCGEAGYDQVDNLKVPQAAKLAASLTA